MELTLLGTVGLIAFVISGGAVMLVSAFRRTLELRAALLHALKRIEGLERAIGAGASVASLETAPAAMSDATAAAPEPSLADLADVALADDGIEPPRLVLVAPIALIASATALIAAQTQVLSAQAGIVLVLIVGLAVVFTGEWRHRAGPPTQSWRNEAAMGAAVGLALMLAAVLYGRFAIGALQPSSAFFIAALLAFAGAGLASWHGPLLLAVACAAAFVAPNLAPIGADGAWGHYALLFAFTAALAHLAQKRDAPIWAWLAFAQALFWAGNAAFIGGAPGLIAIEGLYIAGLAVLGFVYAWDEPNDAFPFSSFWSAPWRERATTALLVSAGATLALLALALTHSAPAPNAGAGLIAFAAFAAAAGAARPHFWYAPLFAAAVAAVAVGAWPAFGGIVDAPGILTLAAALGFLFSLGGWAAMLHRDPRPGALLASLAPLAIFAAALTRIGEFGGAHLWAAAGAALAAINLIAHLQLRRNKPLAAAPFAAAATLALAAALTAIAPRGYAPLVLSAALPLIALAHRWRDEAGLRLAAILLAIVLVVRLVAPEVFIVSATNAAGVALAFGPAAFAAVAAAILFARASTVSQTMWAAALAIIALASTLIARHAFTSGAINAPYASLGEAGLNTLIWLALSTLIAFRFGTAPSLAPRALEALAFGGALMQAFLICGVALNPWWGIAPAPVHGWTAFNLIELAFVAPGALCLAHALIRMRQGRVMRAGAAAASGIALLFLALVLEVRRLFHGAEMAEGAIGGAEAWAYSGALLALAGVLGALGRPTRALQIAALALALLALAKMAFSDIVSLEGGARIGAFAAILVAAGALAFIGRRFILPSGAVRPKTLSGAIADPNPSPPG